MMPDAQARFFAYRQRRALEADLALHKKNEETAERQLAEHRKNGGFISLIDWIENSEKSLDK